MMEVGHGGDSEEKAVKTPTCLLMRAGSLEGGVWPGGRFSLIEQSEKLDPHVKWGQ